MSLATACPERDVNLLAFEQNQARWVIGHLLKGYKHDLVVTFVFIGEIMGGLLVAVYDHWIVHRFIRDQDGLKSFY